jgi:phosphoserine phosphatase RsbU/P
MLYLENQAVVITQTGIVEIVLGTVFLFIGLVACAIAAIRGHGRTRILVWQGIFSGMYGIRMLAFVPAVFSLFPQPVSAHRDSLVTIISYLIVVPVTLFWMEMSVGTLRRIFQITFLAASVNGIAGVCSAFIFRWRWDFMLYNKAVLICFLVPLAFVNAVPSLARRYMLFQSQKLTVATSMVALAALYNNLQAPLHLPSYPSVEPISFAVFILFLGFVAADKVFTDERRLLSIENELAIAREIQTSILPSCIPEIKNLCISATYRPMTAVAGDFYEFIVVDPNCAGFLVADVSGHGVPAALIASMIKVAMQSVVPCADDPSSVLRGVERSLFGQLRGQFVSAAYLWLDTVNRKGLYSAAGHPPLLHWRQDKLQSIQSNGLIFGVKPDCDYPVCEISIAAGDRFLLYTDGLIEPENIKGESFGERRLEEVVRENQSRPCSELSDRMLSELRHWQPAPAAQQDDITLIVIDVL